MTADPGPHQTRASGPDVRLAQPRHRRRRRHAPGRTTRADVGRRGRSGPARPRPGGRPLSFDEREALLDHLEGRARPAGWRQLADARAPGDRQAARATRSSRSSWRSTTWPGPPRTPARCCGRRRVSSGLLMANQAAHRGVPAARRDRRDRAVELPGLHADGLDRLRPRRRQRGGLQAQRVHPRRRRVAGRPFARGGARARRCCRSSPVSARPARRCAAPAVDKIAFTGSTATGKKVMAACAETLTPVLIEAGGKDALLVDEDADLEAAADAAAVGRLLQRRPDLHRRRAGLRPRAGLRRVPRRAHRQAARAAGRRRRRQDRPDDDAQPARRGPRAHRRRAGRGGRACVGGADAVGRAVRAADGARRRARGLPGRAGGDLRPDA